jgi:hypothetical protein
MSDQRGYRVRGAPIIHDTIDNETIAINQLTGAYYSLEGPSAVAWELLVNGTTASRIAAELRARFDAQPAPLAEAVAEFLEELLNEELIAEAEPQAAEPEEGPGPSESLAARPPFPGLRLQRYTDLEVLLLADPIHEVDDTGWPTPLAQSG